MRMYLMQYGPQSLTLGVDRKDLEEVGWLQRMSLYEQYPLEVTIAPAARTADVDRTGRVAALTSQVKLRCSTVGVELVDELVTAVTQDIAQRYEAIIAERVATSVELLRPELVRDERHRLSNDRHELELKVKSAQLDEVKQQLAGAREFRDMLGNMDSVLENSLERIEELRDQLDAEVYDLSAYEHDYR